ncbi:MAG: hypothetical protein ACKOA2_06595 [Ilumatobacteraceae bacterium]
MNRNDILTTALTNNANIDRLTDTVWTGGDLPADRERAIERILQWHDLGIRRIIDCRIEWNDRDLVAATAPEIEYFHFGVDDAGQQMPGEWFDRVTGAANSPEHIDLPVLVHCHMGINRGPSGAFAVLLSRGIDPIEAISMIRDSRPIAAVSYAEDALAWWHDTNGTSPTDQADDFARLAMWRAANHHDTARIIRQIRAGSN